MKIAKTKSKKTNRIVYRAHEKGVSIATACRLVGLPRSTFYASKQESKVAIRDLPIEGQIIELQKKNNQVLGRRKMKKLVELELKTTVSEARVGRIMKKLNLCSLIRRKSSYRIRAKQWQTELPEYILNREFKAQRPGEKFMTDITYIPYVEGTTWK